MNTLRTISCAIFALLLFIPETQAQTKAADARQSVRQPAQLMASGGPDAFGYSWKDSDEADGPAYSFADISGTGTTSSVSTEDDEYEAITLPFAFSFYGQDHSTLYIGSNGLLAFNSDDADEYGPEEIPDDDEPNNFIAPLWTDLDPEDGGTVYYEHDAANDRFIVQYDGVLDYDDTGTYTFQVILNLDGSIILRYEDLTGELDDITVGTENAAGDDGLQIVNSQSYLKDSLAIRIATRPPGAPYFTSIPATRVEESTVYRYDVATTDSDGPVSALTLAATTRPSWLSFADNGDGTGTLSGTPPTSAVGDHDVVLEVTDADGKTTTQGFTIRVTQPLAGTYTIGGGGDYASFTEAANALRVNGVGGAVTMEALAGTYAEQVTVDSIPGASAQNPVTFTSQSGDSTDVVVSYDASGSSDNYVVRLRGAEHVTFEQLTLEATDGTYARVVTLTAEPSDVAFQSNVFESSSGSRFNKVTFYANDTPTTNLRVENNRFTGWDYGFYLEATPSSHATGTAIRGNIFENPGGAGETAIRLDDHEDADIAGNTVSGATTGMQLQGSGHSVRITKNEVEAAVNGIYLNGSDASSSRPGLIANNTITINASGTGLFLNRSSDHRILHNSVNAPGGGQPFVQSSGSASGIELVNNVFYTGGGTAFIAESTTGVTSNYNDFYTTGTTLAQWGSTEYSDLAAYQSASGQDANSVSVDPAFASTTDLTPSSPFIDDEGTSLAAVTDDIDGTPRDASAPSLGAVEFTSTTQPLAGTYTIGGTGADYADFDEAVEALRASGVSGAVTFEVADGTYQEQITIPPVGNASATNTVTFRSASGDSTAVVLEANNVPLTIEGADHLRFEQMSFEANGFGGFGDVRAVELARHVEDVLFRGNRFLVRDSDAIGLYADRGTLADSLVVEGSRLDGGGAAMHLQGDTRAPMTDVRIAGNVFDGQRYRAIHLEYHEAAWVTGNTVIDADGNGIEIEDAGDGLRITKNTLQVDDTGIHVEDNDASAGNEGLVANNVITSNGFGPGMQVERSTNLHIYHNSVYVSGDDVAFDGSGSGGGGTELKNNIFAATGQPALDLDSDDSFTLDYNDLFTTGGVLVRYDRTEYSDLTSYQQATSQDSNSVSIDPAFASETDLTPASPFLDDAGTPLAAVTDDIGGNARDATAPSLGAIEYTSTAQPLAGTYTIGDTGPDYASFSEAINALRASGVSGAVTFEVADGTYQEQVTLPAIVNASATNTITFRSASGDSTAVVLEADDVPLSLQGADHVRFERMTFEATSTARDVRAVALASRVENVRFTGNRFSSRGQGFADDGAGIYAGASTVTDSLVVEGNRFVRGESGIYLRGDRDDPSTGTVVANNVVDGPDQNGIYLLHHDGAEVTDNQVRNTLTGLELQESDGPIRVLRNRVTSDDGIYINRSTASSGSEGLVANNVIVAGGTGLRANRSAHQRIYHNSVNVTTTGGPAFQGNGSGGSGTEVKNNIFATDGSEALHVVANGANFDFDYNDLFTLGPVLVYYDGTDYADLASYQQATSQAAKSIAVNPAFASDSDLTPSSSFADDEGVDLTAVVPDDIDGRLRSSSPSLGAIEYTSTAQPLAGTYTIGGSGADYADFGEATDALRAAGVSGAVTFEVADGTYQEQITIPPLGKASATNTVTFRSASGDSTAVVLAASVEPLMIEGGDHLRFEQMTFEATSTGFSDVRAVVLTSRVEDVQFIDSRFSSRGRGSAERAVGLFGGDDAVTDSLVIEGNHFADGGSGIYLESASSEHATGTVIASNVFDGPSERGIYLRYHDGPEITGNTITGAEDGVWIERAEQALRITKNDIEVASSGIHVDGGGASAGNEGLIANNTISADGDAPGLRVDRSAHQRIYHNSVNMTVGGGEAFHGDGYRSSGGDVKNNIFAAAGGPAMHVENGSNFALDYNDLYSTGSVLVHYDGSEYADLGAYQSGAGQGANALMVDPHFVSDTDLTPAASELEGAGADLTAVVPDDMEGAVRDSSPSLGAVEFSGDDVQVTFRVDMRQVQRLALYRPASGMGAFVEVFDGEFAGRFALQDVDGDSIWTASVGQVQGETISYAYGIDPTGRGDASELIYELDGADGARSVTLPASSQALSVVPFDDRSPEPVDGGYAALQTRAFQAGDPAAVDLAESGQDTYLTLDLDGLDRPLLVAVRRYAQAPGDSTETGVRVGADDTYWAIETVPAAAQFTAQLEADYSSVTLADAVEPALLELLRRESSGVAWRAVDSQADTTARHVTAADIDSLGGGWTLGSTATRARFRVDMRVMQRRGLFQPGEGMQVFVEVLEGDYPGRTLLSDADGDSVWTGEQTVGLRDSVRYAYGVEPQAGAPPSDWVYELDAPAGSGRMLTVTPDTSPVTPVEAFDDQTAGPVVDAAVRASRALAGDPGATEYDAARGDTYVTLDPDALGSPVLTTVSRIDTSAGGTAPQGIARISTAFYVHLNAAPASASFDGTLAVDYSLLADGIVDPAALRLLHRDAADAAWSIATTTVDDEAHEILADDAALRGQWVVASASSANVLTVPDLTVASVQVPSAVTRFQTISVAWTLENESNGSTGANQWYDYVWISQDTDLREADDMLLGRFPNQSALDAGDSYTNTRTLSLPEGVQAPGAYVFVTTDINDAYTCSAGRCAHDKGTVVERVEIDNNFAYRQIEVNEPPPVDLAVTNFTAPGNAFSGDRIALGWTVQNESANATVDEASTWSDVVYLSSDSVLTEDDQRLDAERHDGVLQPDSSYQVSLSGRLPQAISGERHLILVADQGDVVYEDLQRDNNRAVQTLQVTLSPPPDLVVDRLDVAPQEQSGDTTVVEWTVTNQGAGAPFEDQWVDRIYRSRVDTLDPSTAEQVARVVHADPLPSQSSYTEDQIILLPNGVTGTFYYFVQTDAGGDVFEFEQENNNVSAPATSNVTLAPSADLNAVSLSVQSEEGQPIAQAQGGERVRLAWRVENVGQANTSANVDESGARRSWRDRIYFSTLPMFDEADAQLLDDVRVRQTVAPGGAYEKTSYAELPSALDGDYYFYLVANADDAIYQHDEQASDSIRTSDAVSIAPEPPETPDNLALSALAVRTSDPASGDSLDLEWVVTNEAAEATPSEYWTYEIYLSGDSARGGDRQLAEVSRRGGLSGGRQVTEEHVVRLPDGVSGSQHAFVELANSTDTTPDDNVARTPTAFSVRLTPSPNLRITARPTAQATDVSSGQPVTATWTVENDGDTTATGSWRDVLYLSRDDQYDNRDEQLGHTDRAGSLAVGESYQVQVRGQIPLDHASGGYYLIARTDAQDALYEHEGEQDNSARSALSVTLPPPADLEARNVQGPDEAQPNSTVQVSYDLANTSSNPAQGEISDAVFFSADSSLDAEDAFVGLHTHQIDVAAASSQQVDYTLDLAASPDSSTAALAMQRAGTESFSGEVPGLTPGSYRIIVKPNVRRTIREADYADAAASSDLTSIGVPTLTIGTPDSLTLDDGAQRFLAFDAQGGEDLRLTLDAGKGLVELFVSRGEIPSRSFHDYRYEGAVSDSVNLTIPEAESGRYYVLAYAEPGAGEREAVLSARELTFTLTDVHVQRIGDFGAVTLIVDGARFSNATQMHLQKGSRQIEADVVRPFSSTQVLARFRLGVATRAWVASTQSSGSATSLQSDIDPIEHGAWDLVASNPGDATMTLADAVTVEDADPYDVEVSVDVPPNILVDRETPATLRVHNPTNVDVARAIITIYMPSHVEVRYETNYDLFFDEPAPKDSLNRTVVNDDGQRELTLALYGIPPGQTATMPLYVRPTTTETVTFSTQYLLLNDFHYALILGELVRAVEREAGSAGGGSGAVSSSRASAKAGDSEDCEAQPAANSQASAQQLRNCDCVPPAERHVCELMNDKQRFRDALSYLRKQQAAGFIADESKRGLKMAIEEVLDRMARGAGNALLPLEIWTKYDEIEELYEKLKEKMNQESDEECPCPWWNPFAGDECEEEEDDDDECTRGVNCGPLPEPPVDRPERRPRETKPLDSQDPNDILGPDGYGAENWVAAQQELSYTIRFENDPELATAPARTVTIRQPIDEDLDLGSFRLGTISFGSFDFTVPEGRSYYSTRLDVRDSLGVYVEVTAGLDVTRREAFWVLRSIDPETGQSPATPLLGFLPVNDSTGRGQGSVRYAIRPESDAATGTRLDAQAEIVFDQNAPISTPSIFNTVESGLPSSQLAPLSASEEAGEIILRWSGQDDSGGTGIESYSLYAAKDGGTFSRYRGGIEDTSFVFAAERGHEYRFFVRARDRAGNQEPFKGEAEGQTILGSTALVYSGDTNDDGIVDQADLLPIGVYFGATGSSRGSVSGWSGQAVPSWAPPDAAYADANGDGEVDQNDVLPIGTFFGESRSAAKSAPARVEAIHIPPLPVGKTFSVHVRAGSREQPIEGLLGAAAALTVPSTPFELVSVTPDDRLDDGDLMALRRHEEEEGRLALAFTRKGAENAVASVAGKPVITVRLKVTESMQESVEIALRDGDLSTAASGALGDPSRLTLTSPEAVAVPEEFVLEPNYPNPFQQETSFRFALPEQDEVTIEVFDLLGRRVALVEDESRMKAGWHQVHFDARRLASGVYIYRLRSGDFTKSRKMVLVK